MNYDKLPKSVENAIAVAADELEEAGDNRYKFLRSLSKGFAIEKSGLKGHYSIRVKEFSRADVSDFVKRLFRKNELITNRCRIIKENKNHFVARIYVSSYYNKDIEACVNKLIEEDCIVDVSKVGTYSYAIKLDKKQVVEALGFKYKDGHIYA